MAQMNMVQAINSAMDIMLTRDPDVIIMGEDVGYFGGVFRCTDGLQRKHGEHRVLDTHERREPPWKWDAGDRHVWRWSVAVSPAASSMPWSSAGRITAKPSRQPPGEPGRLTTSVCPRRPATPRESSA